jgi:hypothetical protein
MELKQEMFDGIADNLLQTAKRIRGGYKYSEDEKMAQCAVLITPDGKLSMIPMLWSDTQEKHRKFRALYLTAKEADASAIALIADSRWLESPLFCEHFKIPTPLEIGIEQFQKKYLEILRRYGGEIKNLPRYLWKEAVIVCIKGPGIEPRIRMAPYVEGRRDAVEWLPPRISDHDKSKIYMLPDWWTVQ